MLNRAWSTLDIKAIDREHRIIEGIASTPTPDRSGDVLDPSGAQFSLPMPFLWQHKDSIGEVFEADVRPNGIYIKAKVSDLDAKAPASLKARIEEAWHSMSAKPPLARGLSVGWNPVESQPIKGTRFTRYLKWIWGETSAVVIPMNTDATILSVKSSDLAATGHHTPGDTGTTTVVRVQKDARAMTTAEQIQSFEAKRAANVAAMNSLMLKSEGATLDEAQREEYTTLEREVESIDEHLPRLKKLETMNKATATAITATTSAAAASELRGGSSTMPVITVKPNVPKGTAFVRYAMALAANRGNKYEAIEYAKQWDSSTPEVGLMLKAAVAAGSTTDATWAGPLAVAKPSTTEFLELLRPSTLIGKISNFRNVPFNISVPSQTAGGTYQWVGQGAPKPIGTLQFSAVTLGIAKAAGIIVTTEELVRLATPSAEDTVRQDMTGGMSQYLDTQFIDPSVAAVANVSPGSVTNGTTPITTAGTSPDNARTDLKALVASFVTANLTMANAVFVMSEANGFALGSALNALGQPLFPGMGANGGTILGVPVVTSQSAGTTVALIDARGILMADEGGLSIDISREASVQMDSAPDNPATATTVMTSFWQNNLVGFKAERWINWKRGRPASVKYVVATYV